MKNSKGHFVKGTHWRQPKPYWDKAWLYREYIEKEKPANQIAIEHGCTENNILYFLAKHGIPRRTTSDIRTIKHWGAKGKDNPMYGVRGIKHPRWKGGYTPYRQRLYNRLEGKGFFRIIGKRDNWKCKWCGSNKKLCVHHIIPFRKMPLLPLDPDNAIMLCQDCHYKTYGKEKRYAKKFFKMIQGGDSAGRATDSG